MRHGSDAARNRAGENASRSLARQAVPVALVGAAVFLVVLILARTPLQGFVVSQRVSSAPDRASSTTPLATEQVVEWLKSDAVLATAVQQVCPRESLAAHQNLIAELNRGLDVQPDSARQTQFGWQLTLQHRDRQLASQLLTALSESLKSQLKNLDQAEAQLLVQHHQRSLLVARDEEDSARQTLERARHELLTVARHVTPNQPLDLTPAAPETPRTVVNPLWQELQIKVQAAQARLDQLLTARTPAHPQVIEAQAQLSQLQQLLEQTPRDPNTQLPKATNPAPESDLPGLQGPQLREAAMHTKKVSVRLVSTAEEASSLMRTTTSAQLEQLTSRWSAAAAKRAAIEHSLSDAQQQWVRGLNSDGWQVSPSWTQAQLGGRATHQQLLLAGSLALCAALGTWRLTYLATRDGSLSTTKQLAETLPLPVIGSVPVTASFAARLPERRNSQVALLCQLSLAVLGAMVLVIAWANSIDTNLSSQWSSDPISALGQAFDLLQHRMRG